ncbi:PREDICTED: uncharacterized protein LOC107351610 [Acropora digitifera]|uniref:uncharacterized protein LOC107351610 n=1 Tax=Acropora digitifera TaxID=70779 RepID=UPI00077A6A03|nr:PREDICTED: uncharacterized protein LOC107351610 [Acropora digitifera]
MKRHNSNSTISKLGESAYNALLLTNPVNGDERRIVNFSYNLSAGEEGTSEFSKNRPSFLGAQRFSRRALSKEEKQSTKYAFHNELQRSNSDGNSPRKEKLNFAKEQLYFDPGDSIRESARMDASASNTQTISASDATTHTRKYGLGETANVSLMSHKLRKKAVCDSTDNSLYQRQFLRVLNKRF